MFCLLLFQAESSIDSFDQWAVRSYASEDELDVIIEDCDHVMWPVTVNKTKATVKSLKTEVTRQVHRLLFEGKDLDDDMMLYGNLPPDSTVQMVATIKSIDKDRMSKEEEQDESVRRVRETWWNPTWGVLASEVTAVIAIQAWWKAIKATKNKEQQDIIVFSVLFLFCFF